VRQEAIPDAAPLWVDVSALLRCRGAFTGIPRTIAALVLAWMEREDLYLRFCHYDRDWCAYVAIPREQVSQLLQARRAVPPGGAAAPPGGFHPLAAVRAGLWRLVRSLPHNVRATLRRLQDLLHERVRFVCCRAITAARRLAGRFRRADVLLRSPFAAGDSLLIPGGWWDDIGSFALLWELKQQTGLKVAYLIYDLIPCKRPELVARTLPAAFRCALRAVVPLADQIATISENSCRDLLALAEDLGTPAPPVRVIRLGDDPVSDQGPVCPAGLPAGWQAKPFVLTVGTVEVRKNHRLLYHVWHRLIEQFGPQVPPLVVAGEFGWLVGDLRHEIQTDPLMRDHLFFLPRVADAELRWLYEHCLFTLYPSHYEGWGLPVAEGLARGKYCIASSSTALPEVGGDLIDYHDPLDFAECFRLVQRALFEDGFVRQREERLRRAYRAHSWAECAACYAGWLERDLGRRFRRVPTAAPVRRSA
jgi:glycosyltransferase involved in cell wall biosynthesis